MVVGHQRILELLPRLKAHTLLFSGPEGVGRRAVARWFCEFLNSDPSRMDYLEVSPQIETKSGRKARNPQIVLDQIAPREESEGGSLLEWLQTYPRHKAKVGVIDGAHLLNESAANALLKALEEPPAFARLILIAPSREVVLPTLVSRSLEISFAPLPEAVLHQLTTDPEVLTFAEGSYGKAHWAINNPAEFGKLTGRTEGVLEALQTSPAQTLEALKLLLELDDALPYLSRKLRQTIPPESPSYRETLETFHRASEALSAYVSEDLVQTWLGLRLVKAK
jgi:DNA polymerase III subunit delta'